MKAPSFNVLRILSLSALALWAAAPAGATDRATGSSEFKFEIDASLLGEAFVLAPVDGAAAGDRSQLFQIAAAGSLAAQDLGGSPRVSAQTTTSSSKQSGKGGFGRWLKRHWWAPTLVGVALGVVLLEPFDDDKVDDPR